MQLARKKPFVAFVRIPILVVMSDDRELIAAAESLEVPWRRLLESEIEAERKLRRCVGTFEAQTPLWRALVALQMSPLESWRVRERVQALAWEARSASPKRALQELRTLFSQFSGKSARASTELFARHLEFAYQRVLELQRAARAAEKTRGTRVARVRRVIEQTGCLEADASWAVDRAMTARGRTIVEDAIRLARAEGFEIPRARTEFKSWVMLRRFARRGRLKRRRRGARRQAAFRATRPVASPVPMPAWSGVRTESRFPPLRAGGSAR